MNKFSNLETISKRMFYKGLGYFLELKSFSCLLFWNLNNFFSFFAAQQIKFLKKF